MLPNNSPRFNNQKFITYNRPPPPAYPIQSHLISPTFSPRGVNMEQKQI